MFYIVVCVIAFAIIIFGLMNIKSQKEIENLNKKLEIEKPQRQAAAKKKRQAEEEKYNNALNELVSRFGECAVDINLGEWNEHRIDKRLLVFETAKIVIINSVEYKFKDILGFSLVDDKTSETITTSTGNAKTSTGSMIGRAVVGGVLTGGLGAVAGAATAKKKINTDATSQTKTKHDYTLYINVNNIQKPITSINISDNSAKAQKLAAIFNVIIERNKENA